MLLLKLKGDLNFHMVQVDTFKVKMLMLAKFPICLFFVFLFRRCLLWMLRVLLSPVDRENRAEMGVEILLAIQGRLLCQRIIDLTSDIEFVRLN